MESIQLNYSLLLHASNPSITGIYLHRKKDDKYPLSTVIKLIGKSLALYFSLYSIYLVLFSIYAINILANPTRMGFRHYKRFYSFLPS